MARICTHSNCPNMSRCKGLCAKHYTRLLRHGDPQVTLQEQHGRYLTLEYETWHSMIQRCTNIKCRAYKYYGGRGIRVCDSWLHSFTAFFKDMGKKPTKAHSIERINNDGNYEPSNCRWATMQQQSNNRRLTRDTNGRWASAILSNN